MEIPATRLTDDEIALLLAILEEGASHATHPYRLGASSADGWGRVTWSRADVKRWDASAKPVFAPASVGFACCTQDWPSPANSKPSVSVPAHASVNLVPDFHGSFLVNDALRVKTDNMSDSEKRHTQTSHRSVGPMEASGCPRPHFEVRFAVAGIPAPLAQSQRHG